MSALSANNFLEWSLLDVSTAIKRKKVSPREVTQALLQEIRKKNPEINAYITVMEEAALRKAQKAEKEVQKGNVRGPLHGIPIGLKDLIYTKGVRTTFGSGRYKDFLPDYDAEIVTRLEKAGAIIIGKLNMHQFAYGATGDRSYFGPARNPHNPQKITGGSSSGSGAAVAAHLCYGAIGSDTGGSIRIPSSACGIVGLKPTFGRVSKHGAMTLCWTLDHLGPMTKTVRDNALLLNAISGYDPKDSYSLETKPEDFTRGIQQGIKGMTIGIPTSYYFDIIQDEVLRIYHGTVDRLKRQGAKVKEIDLPYMNQLSTAQQVIITVEAHNALEKEIREAPEQIDEEVRARIFSGIFIRAGEYLNMLKVKNLGIKMFGDALKKVDAIITPTLWAVPTDIEERQIDFNGRKEPTTTFSRLTGPANTIGFPAISVPGGSASNGLPVGIQLIGAPFDEKTLYRIAYAVEQSNS
jgi:aspartyl-tRNA(Asn)/glutamyl-tRNA(Gln) amidotransferase subunit A